MSSPVSPPTTPDSLPDDSHKPGGHGEGRGRQSITTTPSAAPLPQPTVIKFDDQANFDGNDNKRVFATQNGNKVFKWQPANETVTLKDITWYGRNSPGDVDSIGVIGNTTLIVSDGGGSAPFTQVSTEDATLNLQSLQLLGWYRKPMIIKINWETPDATGYSESGVFTVADVQVQGGLQFIEQFNQNAAASYRDAQGGEVITTKNGGDSTSTTEATPLSSSSGGGGGGGGGLSTGAIAGIAVAVAVVLVLLVGALTWFLLRRRRRRRGSQLPQTASSFMADKEEAQARVVDESTASPYSDDGQQQQQQVARDVVQTAPRDNAEQSPLTTSTSSGSRADDDDDNDDDAQTLHGVSRNIAHLVEDGMTPEEIWRLEEEERQLDAEIERAARV